MAAPTSWNRDTLPQGDEKRTAVREMFDAIAPRYDLVNRVMTFRLDVRWRRRAVRELDLPAGSRVLDLASGTGDLCVDLARAGHRPVSIDLSLGMLRADHSGAPRVQADILRLPVPDAAVDGVTCGFALRNLVDLDTFFVELARVVRPGGRIALLDVGTPHNGLVRWGHAWYFGRVVPRIGGLLSDAAAYRYLPRSVAYLPPPERARGCAPRSGLPHGGAPRAERRHHPTHHRDPLMRAVTSPAGECRIDLDDVARGDGFLFVRDGVGIAGRGITARAPVDDIPALLAAIDHDGPTEPGLGPVAIGWLPFEPGQPGEMVVPSVVVRVTADRRTWVTVIDDAAEELTPVRPPTPSASGYTIESVTPISTYLAAVEAVRGAVRDGQLTKAVIAREIAITADRPIDRHGVLQRLRGVVRLQLPVRHRRPDRRLAGTAGRGRRSGRAVAPAGRHRSAHR